jgi:hypothetical protein
MIIFKIYVEGVLTLKPKGYAPVAAYRDTPGASAISHQSMQPITRQIHISRCTRAIKHVQLATKAVGKFRGNAPPHPRFKEPLQSFMAKAPDHR